MTLYVRPICIYSVAITSSLLRDNFYYGVQMQSFASTDGKPSPELAQDMHYSYPKPHRPKDPRTKRKFNVLSRLLFW